MISVDGDMSTNDAVYAFAPATRSGEVREVRGNLARALVPCAAIWRTRWWPTARARPKTLEVRVTGARDVAQARTIARAIVNSNLVKTALYGEDPNWGRIVAAAGAARAGIDPQRWSLYLNERRGWAPARSRCSPRPKRIANWSHRDRRVELRLGFGSAEATGWGCDLSRDYVRINASYRT